MKLVAVAALVLAGCGSGDTAQAEIDEQAAKIAELEQQVEQLATTTTTEAITTTVETTPMTKFETFQSLSADVMPELLVEEEWYVDGVAEVVCDLTADASTSDEAAAVTRGLWDRLDQPARDAFGDVSDYGTYTGLLLASYCPERLDLP